MPKSTILKASNRSTVIAFMRVFSVFRNQALNRISRERERIFIGAKNLYSPPLAQNCFIGHKTFKIYVKNSKPCLTFLFNFPFFPFNYIQRQSISERICKKQLKWDTRRGTRKWQLFGWRNICLASIILKHFSIGAVLAIFNERATF